MSTAIEKRRPDVYLTNPQDRLAFLNAVAKSGKMKKHGELADLYVKVQAGLELGMTPFQAITSFDIIDGALSMNARAMAARVASSGTHKYRMNVEKSSDTCSVIDWFEKEGDNWVLIGQSSFSLEDAKLAGLIKDKSAWQKHPKDMLWARALSQGYRRFTPHLSQGTPLYIPDELGVEDAQWEVKDSPEDQLKIIESLIEKTGADKNALLSFYGKSSLEELSEEDRMDAVGKLSLKLGGKK